MKERPILFSYAMVRQILAGEKTQTRRIMKPQPVADAGLWRWPTVERWRVSWRGDVSILMGEHCPYGVPGDRLWVRETWADLHDQRSENGAVGAFMRRTIYAADRIEVYGDMSDPERVNVEDIRWKPSIFMKRATSRIDLEVVSVRVERLQDITETDIRAEGVTIETAHKMAGVKVKPQCTLREAWALGWNVINGDRAPWASNPWVWRVEFRRVRP